MNRYAYVYNNPLRYTDPTGHFTQDEIIKYLGMDSREDVQDYFKDTPDVLHMLSDSNVTWGTVLRAGNEGDLDLNAVFLLLGRAGDDNYRLTLWDVDKGTPLHWKDLQNYTQIGVWSNSGRVYENYSGATKGFSLSNPSVVDDQIPVPDGYQVGRWMDLNEALVGKIGFLAAWSGFSPAAGVAAGVNTLYALHRGTLIDKEYPYIEAPYEGMGRGGMYDENGVPHVPSPLTVSFMGPLGPASKSIPGQE